MGSPNFGLSSGPHSLEHLASSVDWTLGERSYSHNWDRYWERNEPLRDADEVAIPVLCICSRDDPLLPPASSLPLPLFQSNPYFFLLLTDRGGHCGFTVEGQEEVQEDNWSHTVTLEYFRAVADFLKDEERDVAHCGDPLGEHSQTGQRNGISIPPRRRTPLMMRKQRRQAAEQSSEDGKERNFTWRRSYTR